VTAVAGAVVRAATPPVEGDDEADGAGGVPVTAEVAVTVADDARVWP
jgi:hypothetical protein